MSDVLDDLKSVTNWYISADKLLKAIQKAFSKDPDGISSLLWPREGEPVGEAIRHLQRTRDELRDYTVLALFSVFESWLEEDFDRRSAMVGVKNLRDKRKISDLLDTYRPIVSAVRVGEVKQIKGYRDWVAHGRRGSPNVKAHPQMAFERLSNFIRTAHETQEEH